MIPTTEPTRLLSANNNTTATINHRHRAPTQSPRISFQSRDSSPEIVMIQAWGLSVVPPSETPSADQTVNPHESLMIQLLCCAFVAIPSESGRPDLSCGRLRRSSLVSAVTSQTAFADYILPPRLNLRFWRPPSAAAACSLTRARKSGRQSCWFSTSSRGARI